MSETRWAFHRIIWTLYRDAEACWVAFSSTSDNHRTPEKEEMESWLKDRGLRTANIEKLFEGAEKDGEATVAVSQLHEPPSS